MKPNSRRGPILLYIWGGAIVAVMAAVVAIVMPFVIARDLAGRAFNKLTGREPKWRRMQRRPPG
jgi:uncharacterized membrane protein YdjX (TVP38/TMEM64 family)